MNRELTQQEKDIDNNNDFQWGNTIEYLRQNIRSFRHENQLDYVIVVNCISTQSTPEWSEIYNNLSDFQNACFAEKNCITPSMQFACAALLESSGYINFTPNLSEVPALIELSNTQGIPMAGRDGKTGQTLLKTALAPVFKLRGLKVDGWFSTNLIGLS